MSIFRVISICVILLANYGCYGKAQHQSGATGGLSDKLRSYWEKVDAVNLPGDSLEQLIVDYLYLAGHLDRDGRDSIWPDFYKHIHEQPNRTVVDYLGEADSPLHSPALLEEYLINLLKYTDDETVRYRTEYLLDNIRKNPPGTIISDIKVLTENQATSLHHLIGEADMDCLIVFYDPDCSSCDAAFEQLMGMDLTGLRIIAVSITGNTKVLDSSWVSAHVADDEEFEAKFYYTSLPSSYVVSNDGIIKQKCHS